MLEEEEEEENVNREWQQVSAAQRKQRKLHRIVMNGLLLMKKVNDDNSSASSDSSDSSDSSSDNSNDSDDSDSSSSSSSEGETFNDGQPAHVVMVDFFMAMVKVSTYFKSVHGGGTVQVKLMCQPPSFKNHVGVDYFLLAEVKGNYVMVAQEHKERLFQAMMDEDPKQGFKAMRMHPDPSCFVQKLPNKSYPYSKLCAALEVAGVEQVLVSQHGANIPSVEWYRQWRCHLVPGSRVALDMASDQSTGNCVEFYALTQAVPHPAFAHVHHVHGGIPLAGLGAVTFTNHSVGTYLSNDHVTTDNSLHVRKVVEYSHCWVSALKGVFVGSPAKFKAASPAKTKKKLFELMSTLKEMWCMFVRNGDNAVFNNHQVTRVETTVHVGVNRLAQICQVNDRVSPLPANMAEVRRFINAKEYHHQQGRNLQCMWKMGRKTPRAIIKHAATLVELAHIALQEYEPVDGKCCEQIVAMVNQIQSAMVGGDNFGRANSSEIFNPRFRGQSIFGRILHHYDERLLRAAARTPVYGARALREGRVFDNEFEAQFPASVSGMSYLAKKVIVDAYVPKALTSAASGAYRALVNQNDSMPTVSPEKLLRAMKRLAIGIRQEAYGVGYCVKWKDRSKSASLRGALVVMVDPSITNLLTRALLAFPNWRGEFKGNAQYEGWDTEDEEVTEDEGDGSDGSDGSDDDGSGHLPPSSAASIIALIKAGTIGQRKVQKRWLNKNDPLVDGTETPEQASARRKRAKAKKARKAKAKAAAEKEKKKEKNSAHKKYKKDRKKLKKVKKYCAKQLAAARVNRRAKAEEAKRVAAEDAAEDAGDGEQDVEEGQWELFEESGFDEGATEEEQEEQEQQEEEERQNAADAARLKRNAANRAKAWAKRLEEQQKKGKKASRLSSRMAKVRAAKAAKAKAKAAGQKGLSEEAEPEVLVRDSSSSSDEGVPDPPRKSSSNRNTTTSSDHPYYGHQVLRVFHGKNWEGTVQEISMVEGEVSLYKITYEDGDWEELELWEIMKGMYEHQYAV